VDEGFELDEGLGEGGDLSEAKVAAEDEQSEAKEVTVEGGEEAGFRAHGFVWEHGAEAVEDGVESEEEEEAGEGGDDDDGGEERVGGDFTVPVEERGTAEVEEGEDFCAIESGAPDAFLFLEMSEEGESVEEDGGGDDGGEDTELAEPLAFGGLEADDQGDGESPEES